MSRFTDPEHQHSALITIDVQCDTLDGEPFEIPGTSAIAPRLLPSPSCELDAEMLLRGGVQEAGPNEWIIYKPRWGAFFRTPLESHLRGLEVSTLVFSGCNFPNCPRTSIYQASERDLRVVAIEDAISGLYDRGRAELEDIGVLLLGTDSYLQTSRQTATQ